MALVLTRSTGQRIMIGANRSVELVEIRAPLNGGRPSVELLIRYGGGRPKRTVFLRVGDEVAVGHNAKVAVSWIDMESGWARLAVTAPRSVPVDREEIRERKLAHAATQSGMTR